MIEHHPWVGSGYASGGLDGQRIAVMGYSAWTPDDHTNYTIESVQNVISGAWKSVRFFNDIASYFDRSVADFYERVVFFEFVPCSVGGGDDRYAVATHEQAEVGRQRAVRIIEEHDVQKLLVFSSKAWGSMSKVLEAGSGDVAKLSGTNFRVGHYEIAGKRRAAFGLRHPQYAPRDLMCRAVAGALAFPFGD